MNQPFEEWDWPPRRAAHAPVEGRIKSEQIILPRAVPKRQNRAFARLANAFSLGVFALFRAALIIGLAVVLFGSLSLIWLIMSP